MSTGDPMELGKPTQLDQARGISNARSESMSLKTMIDSLSNPLEDQQREELGEYLPSVSLGDVQ